MTIFNTTIFSILPKQRIIDAFFYKESGSYNKSY